jgi:hypothetical protein
VWRPPPRQCSSRGDGDRQQRAVAPGEATEVPVDLRVVAATHRDLREMVRQGTFREDLYFRLAVFPVTLPPLREPGRDVVTLARSLLSAGVLGARPRAELLRGHGLRAARALPECEQRKKWRAEHGASLVAI